MANSTKSEVIAFRIVLSGKVQKIGFRKWIQSVCSDASVSGWVKNRKTHLPTQVVDLHIEGTNETIYCVLPVILKGSDKSEVTSSSIISLPPTYINDFSILTGPEEFPFGESSEEVTSQLLSKYREQTAVLSQSLIDSFKNLHRANHLTPKEVNLLGESAIIEYIPESTFKAFKEIGLSYGNSFTSELWMQTHFRNDLRALSKPSAETILNNKDYGLQFANALGLRTPVIYKRNISLNDINFSEKTVIKPTSGAGGKAVYLLHSQDNIKDITLNRTLYSYQELREAMRHSLKVKHAKRDSWQIEELIVDSAGDNANDLKALAFYGKVALIQEIKRPPMQVCYYDAGGSGIQTGRHEGNSFQGSGFSREFVELAESISLKIPAPFMRIDFYNSNQGLVYGEFTPRPGGFHEYNLKTDRELGRAFIKARARLFYDLYHGKKFPEFDALVADIPKQKPA